ncbi:unnamed protein product [Prorocentrum cordatum]|uniref:SAP domain-containing protein n=1 Tax=Prorocentrum cordatum TaxID=2364126 RepID=A0ABN9UI61_9DINO|nr:unnamed protein product [Polarella glacialis]
MDYCFMGIDEKDSETATVLVIQDSASGYMGAAQVTSKGPSTYTGAFLSSFCDDVGYPRVTLQSDGEPAIVSLARALLKDRSKDSKDIQTQITLRHSAPGSHASNGLAESAVKVVEGLVRTLKHEVEKKYGVQIKGDSAILSWIIRHVTFVQNRFMYKRNGRTAFEDLKMVRFNSPQLNFAENVLANRSGVPDNRLATAWTLGIWLGRATDTDEHIVGTPTGIVKARTVKRRPKEQQWEKGPFNAMVFPIWSQNDLKEVRDTLAGWTPTQGCQACEDEQAPVRRVGRPRAHTTARLQRQAEFKRRQLQGDCSASRRGSIARISEQFGGSGSSYDADHGEERQPSKRPPPSAADRSDVEITINVIEELRPNEEENDEQMNKRVLPQREFTWEEIKSARYAEFDRLEDFRAKIDIQRTDVDGPLPTTTWVDEARAEGVKSKVCARPFTMPKEPKDILYTPTPGASTLRIVLALATIMGWKAKFFDISRAFLHTPIRDRVFLETPAEYKQYCIDNFGYDPGDVVWLMQRTIYGLNEAMVDFDAHYSDISVNQLGMRRLISEPNIYVSENSKAPVSRHVDDGLVIGEGSAPDDFLAGFGRHFLLKITPEMTTGSSQLHLDRVIKMLDNGRGYTSQIAAKTIESLLELQGVGSGKAVATPGVKIDAKQADEQQLNNDQAKRFRTGTGKMLLIASERYDLQFATKEVSRGISSQTTGDAMRLKEGLQGRLVIGKITTAFNSSDLGTKYLEKSEFERHRLAVGIKLPERGAEGQNRLGVATVKPTMVGKAGSSFVETVYYQLIAVFCFVMFAVVFTTGFYLGYKMGQYQSRPDERKETKQLPATVCGRDLVVRQRTTVARPAPMENCSVCMMIYADDFSVNAIRERCSKHRLDTSGSKSDLIRRLRTVESWWR